MKTLDCRGLECPLPVVKTKEALKEDNVVSTIVDNEIAVQNLTKFANVKGYTVDSEKNGNDYTVKISKIDEESDFDVEYIYPKNKQKTIVVFSSNVMGSNPDLGAILMKSFICQNHDDSK